MSQVVDGHKKEGRLMVAVLACDLAAHTNNNCANQNIFKPEYNSLITLDMVATARMIYTLIRRANEIRVGSDPDLYKARTEKQREALQLCKDLRDMTEIAQMTFKFRSRKLRAWGKKIGAVESKLASWHESDRKAYLSAAARARAEAEASAMRG